MRLIKVTTVSKDGTKEKIIDHDDKGDRLWLGRHCFWAMRNECSVMTAPIDPELPA